MYYLVAHPQTVVSIILYGKLPNPLKLNRLICTQAIENSFDANTTSLHQAFILELVIASPNQEEFLFLEQINPTSIKRVLVYSQQGLSLLSELFGDACPKAIIIQPEVYPNILEKTKKRSRVDLIDEQKLAEDPLIAPLAKRPCLSAAAEASSSQAQEHKLSEQKLPETILDRLTTYAEHLKLLSLAFNNAQRTILITSFSINHETLYKAYLYKLIPEARNRGVKIYIYYNDKHDLDGGIIAFLKKNNVFFGETYTHSKILAVDNNLVATGSFNWLSTIDSQYQESDEGSFVIQGEICAGLIQDFWKHLKYYRNLQFGNEKNLQRFQSNSHNNSTLLYDLDNNTILAYIPTLDQHSGFFQECFEKAKKRLIICSPFISSAGAYEADLDHKLLRKTVARGVDVYFVCRPSKSNELESFQFFLSQINSSKIHLITATDFHLKTIIRDEDIIAEGSFNWLSAIRNDSSDYHNHEQTLYVQGEMAKKLIEKFFKSRIGIFIQKAISKETTNASYSPFFAPVPQRTLSQATQQNHSPSEKKTSQGLNCVIQ